MNMHQTVIRQSTPGQDLIFKNNFFIYFLKLSKLNIGFKVRLGLVLDYFVLYRVSS